ncbi:MAG: transposase, partial [Chloroflexi bacterium]|nr:transposase [Chloroflexota bacterium]
MTRRGIMEYAQAIRSRYCRANRKEKSMILDEFTKVTELHRKAAIRLLRGLDKPRASKRRGRPNQYGAAVQE